MPARNIAHVTVNELPPLRVDNRFACRLVDVQTSDLRTQFRRAANNRRTDARRCARHNDVFFREVAHYRSQMLSLLKYPTQNFK
jgi:hypothetical protein